MVGGGASETGWLSADVATGETSGLALPEHAATTSRGRNAPARARREKERAGAGATDYGTSAPESTFLNAEFHHSVPPVGT